MIRQILGKQPDNLWPQIVAYADILTKKSLQCNINSITRVNMIAPPFHINPCAVKQNPTPNS